MFARDSGRFLMDPRKPCSRRAKWRVSAAAFTALLLIALCGCQTIPSGSPGRPPDEPVSASERPRQAEARIDAYELQSRVMGMADDYASEMSEIVYLLLHSAVTSSRERVLAQSYIRNSFGAAAEIATGPNPEVSLLDLLVLVSLQRATFERHWIPEIWGAERGGPALARLRKLESDLWAQSDVLLSPQQKETLRRLIDTWLRDNPDRLVVALVRFAEFADARHLVSGEDRKAARGLLKEVSQAVVAIDEALHFGERAMWYAGRLIYILGQQTELTAYRILSDPEIEAALDAVDSFQESADRAVRTFEGFPELLRTQQAELISGLSAERQAAIDQFFTRLQAEREQFIGAMGSESNAVRQLLPEIQETLRSATELARAVGESAETIDKIVARVPPATGHSVLENASEVADRWTALLDRAEALLEAPEWNERLDAASLLSTGVIDRIFWRLLVLIVVVIIGVGLLRRIPRR